MRRLLAEMIGLKEHEVMQMTKPAFGDVRAPRQWNETADAALTTEIGLLKHELDGCIYISVRLATAEDHRFRIFEMDGLEYVVDGLFGPELKMPNNLKEKSPAVLQSDCMCFCTGSSLDPSSTMTSRLSAGLR